MKTPKPISTTLEPGIACIKRPGRKPVYRVQLSGKQVGGQRLNRDCSTLFEAQHIRRTWLETGGAAFEAGGAEPPPEPTVEESLRAYCLDLEQRGKTAERVRQLFPVLRRHVPTLLSSVTRDVAPGALFAYRHAREAAGNKANTIITDLRRMRAAFILAGARGSIFKGVLPAENLTRVRFLSPEDEARVFPLLPEPFRTIARLAALTLMRQGDIRTMTRAMVRLDVGLILLPDTKTGPRAVVLGEEAALLLEAVLATMPADVTLVFGNRATGQPYTRVHVSRVWRKAARAAGLQNFTFHDLKHHGASVAVNEGASDAVLMALGGWTRREQILRYAYVANTTLRAMANRIAGGMHRHA